MSFRFFFFFENLIKFYEEKKMPSEILRRGNAINIQPKILHAKCDKLTLSLHCLLAYRLNCVTFVCVVFSFVCSVL